MDPEDSELLVAVTNAVNRAVMAGADQSDPQALFSDAQDSCFADAETLFPEALRASERGADARRRRRRVHQLRVERGILRRFGFALDRLEAALAAAEFVNGSIVSLYVDWLRAEPQKSPDFLGVAGTLGGRHIRLLMLMSMHARTLRVAGEILLLLRAGASEGAASRARTLYELTVKMLLICLEPRDSGWELADRYYVSTQIEVYTKTELFSSTVSGIEAKMRDSAVARWGIELFEGPNNWAAPAVGRQGRGRVTFKDLEDAVGSEELRHVYTECNHAVHAGPLKAVQSIKFGHPYLTSCRRSVDIVETGRTGHAVSLYLQLGTGTIAQTVPHELHEWDESLSGLAFLRLIESSLDAFRELHETLEPPL